MKKCTRCNGSGRVYAELPPPKGGRISETERCPDCVAREITAAFAKSIVEGNRLYWSNYAKFAKEEGEE